LYINLKRRNFHGQYVGTRNTTRFGGERGNGSGRQSRHKSAAVATATISDPAVIPAATMARAKHAFRTISAAGFAEEMEIARGIRGAFMGSNELREGISRFFLREDNA
jgi:hypothetical protein